MIYQGSIYSLMPEEQVIDQEIPFLKLLWQFTLRLKGNYRPPLLKQQLGGLAAYLIDCCG